MPAIFSKNCIFKGDLDSYCLVCCVNLPTEEEILTHIQNKKHKTNLKSYVYIEKHKHDFIKKVKNLYFCEVCNITITTAPKVAIHVNETSHLEAKRGRLLQRVGNNIICDDTLISEDAWNGFIENTCVLCNADFDDSATHKTDKEHILNLIRNKVENAIQCLICNQLVSCNVIKEHLCSKMHENAYLGSLRSKDDYNKEQNVNKSLKDETRVDQDTKDKTDADIDHKNKKTESTHSASDGANGKSLYSKPVVMKDKQKSNSSKSLPEEVQKLAKEHFLYSIIDENKLFCKICGAEVPATAMCIKNHVASSLHKKNMPKEHKANTDLKKKKNISLKDFCKTLHIFEMDDHEYFVINHMFCVERMYFVGFKMFQGKLICQLCQVDILASLEMIILHSKSLTHKNNENWTIVASLENELIRQFNTGVYDCCICQTTEDDWDDMLDHLTTLEHKSMKEKHDQILKLYKKHLIVHEIEQRDREIMQSHLFEIIAKKFFNQF